MNEESSLDRKHALTSDGFGPHKMLKNIHNVERRVDQPTKKVKRVADEENKPT